MKNRIQRGLRVTVVGMVVNIFLAATKLTAGLLGSSHALIADGVESFADIFSSLVVWRGLIISSQPADEDHPYGHGKAEPIAAAVVATTLLLAAVWIGLTALRETFNPHRTPAPFTLVVLILVVAVKEAMFRFALKEATSVGSSAVYSDAWHHRSDAITSIAAAIGISIALLGGPGYESADDIAAILAAAIIASNGWRLLRPAMDELMDASPDLALRAEIRRVAAEVAGVAGVEKCLVRKMGYHYFVDMHLEVDPKMTVQSAHEVAHQVKDRIRSQLPDVYDVLVHIEPSRAR